MSIIKGYKGFDENLQCQQRQYTIGEIAVVEGDLKLCENGIHFCENPLNVLGFYAPSFARYAQVEASGEVLKEEPGQFYMTKCCAREILIRNEISADSLVFHAVAWMRENSNRTPHVWKETYGNDYISITVEPDEGGYWMENTTLLIAANKNSCVINNQGSIAVALGRNSIALSEGVWHTASIANGSQSAAVSSVSGSIAATLGMDSVALAEGNDSVAFAGASSLAICKGDNSVAMSLFRGSKVRLEGDLSMAMAQGPVEVIGKGCVVMLAKAYDKKACIRSVSGTRLLFPIGDGADLVEVVCGVDKAWPAGVPRKYEQILQDYLKDK